MLKRYAKQEILARIKMLSFRSKPTGTIFGRCIAIFALLCMLTAIILMPAHDTLASPLKAAGSDTLEPGMNLGVDQSLVSLNGAYRLQMQGDGNLVLVNAASGIPIWATGTDGTGAVRLSMQLDGNLVLYTARNIPVWASNTGSGRSLLRVQNDRNVVIYRENGGPVWATNTAMPTNEIPGNVHRGRWSQYNAGPLRMMPVNVGLCYLSAIHGNFRGEGEAVRIWAQDGYWMLGGKSGQQDVYAEATCVPYSSIQGSLTYWTSTAWVSEKGGTCPGWPWACAGSWENSMPLGNSRDFCYVTGIGGEFNGGGENVRITVANAPEERPILIVTTHAERGYIRGEAGCIRPHDPGAGYAWKETYPQSWEQGEPDVRLIKASEGFCTLNEIHGNFRGDKEGVAVWYNPDDGYWHLNGASRQNDVGAAARCFGYSPVHVGQGMPID